MKRAAFLTKDQGAMNGGSNNSSATTALVLREDRQTAGSGSSAATPLNNNSSKRVENSLSHVSYWLASSQPSVRANKRGGGDDDDVNAITDFDYLREIEALPPLPPSRPSSPMSGEPLRLKQLVPLHLSYEGDGSSSNSNAKSSSSVICSVSHKVITTQPIIALRGHVMLRDMYERYALPTLTCPITGRKFNVKKDVIELVAGRSGYAASGMVVAKKYNPTLT
jgi:nitric oxide synthase-interacting protein